MTSFIQKIIDRLRGKIFALEPISKKYLVLKSVKEYKTLVLGSSHMDCGYFTENDEINAANASQDLYYSYNLYKYFNSPNLKNVVLSFSVFTSGDFLIKSKYSGICILLKLLYGIPYQFDDLAKQKNLYKEEKYYKRVLNRYIKKLEKSLLPTIGNKSTHITELQDEKLRKSFVERALKHYKINQKTENQLEYLQKLIDETSDNNQNLFIVLTPATSVYKNALPASDDIYKSLYELCKDKYEHVKIINLYDSEVFNDDDFLDGDHVNKFGAQKMTEEIRKYL